MVTCSSVHLVHSFRNCLHVGTSNMVLMDKSKPIRNKYFLSLRLALWYLLLFLPLNILFSLWATNVFLPLDVWQSNRNGFECRSSKETHMLRQTECIRSVPSIFSILHNKCREKPVDLGCPPDTPAGRVNKKNKVFWCLTTGLNLLDETVSQWLRWCICDKEAEITNTTIHLFIVYCTPTKTLYQYTVRLSHWVYCIV